MAGERLHRLQAWAERRLPALTRHRRAEPLPIALHRRRIYIVPTRFGAGFAVLLLVMMVGALNYSNNAALLLTCLLAGASAASMLLAYRSLDGLSLVAILPGQAVAGEPLPLRLRWDGAQQSRPALLVRLDGEHTASAFAVEAGRETELLLSLPTEQRGWQPLPRLKVWSEWPLGLFHAWSWLHPQQRVLVWPRAEAHGPAPPLSGEDPHAQRPRPGDDLAGLRSYRAGDPRQRIAWKASARHHDLLVREFDQPQALPEWHLEWERLHGMDHERRIARLARWLGEAEAERRPTRLSLPGEAIASGVGPAHYAHCMTALARLP